MKQIFSLLLILGLTLNAGAQTPVKENNSLLIETSAAWCGPCGNWGNMFWGMMVTDPYTAYHTMFVTIHPNYGTASDSNELNYTLFSTISDDWGQVVDPWTMFPLFSHNFVDYMASAPNAGVMYNTMMDARDTFLAHAPIASVGFTFKRTGNKFDITTRSMFWQDVTGDYYVGAYLVEDSVLHEQSGSANTLDTMRYIMRTSMSASGGSWGDEIVNGNVKTNQFFNKAFTYTVTDPSWDVTKLKPVVILMKKSGTSYSYINGNNVATATSPDPTYIPNMSGSLNAVALYPNPAKDNTNLSFQLDNATTATISVSDITGRNVYSSGEQHFNSGKNTFAISTAGYASGSYNITISSETGTATQQLTVTR